MPKGTLARIAADKRERILSEAARLFAERGFADTDMAELASRAKVAKGSLYNYFENKEELYGYVCNHGLELSRSAVYGGLDEQWSAFEQVAHMFRQGVAFAERHPQYVALYLNVASAGMGRFADQLSLGVEKPTADLLKAVLRRDQKAGLVRAELPVALTAFHINSLYIMLLASLVSRHFQIRMAEYLDLDHTPTAGAIAQHLEQTLELIRDLLRPAGPGAATSREPITAHCHG